MQDICSHIFSSVYDFIYKLESWEIIFLEATGFFNSNVSNHNEATIYYIKNLFTKTVLVSHKISFFVDDVGNSVLSEFSLWVM